MSSTQTRPDFRVLFESAPGLSLVLARDLRIVAISDSGPGIPTVRKAAFERFFQIEDPATRRHGGAGLRLAVARDFIQLPVGSIDADEDPKGGALFTVELPDESAEHRAKRGQVSTTASTLVLVVKDNADMGAFLSETSMMPDMSGEQLVQALRRESELDSMPVIVLIAKADEDLRVSLLHNGAQDCLVREQIACVAFPARVRIEIDSPADLPQPYIDPVRIGQVVLNLLVNAALPMEAAQAMEDVEGAVTMRARAIDHRVELSRSLAEANGGELRVASEPGKGAAFTLTMPLSDGASMTTAQQGARIG
jgi:signal transduction histidine kinase